MHRLVHFKATLFTFFFSFLLHVYHEVRYFLPPFACLPFNSLTCTWKIIFLVFLDGGSIAILFPHKNKLSERHLFLLSFQNEKKKDWEMWWNRSVFLLIASVTWRFIHEWNRQSLANGCLWDLGVLPWRSFRCRYAAEKHSNNLRAASGYWRLHPSPIRPRHPLALAVTFLAEVLRMNTEGFSNYLFMLAWLLQK